MCFKEHSAWICRIGVDNVVLRSTHIKPPRDEGPYGMIQSQSPVPTWSPTIRDDARSSSRSQFSSPTKDLPFFFLIVVLSISSKSCFVPSRALTTKHQATTKQKVDHKIQLPNNGLSYIHSYLHFSDDDEEQNGGSEERWVCVLKSDYNPYGAKTMVGGY